MFFLLLFWSMISQEVVVFTCVLHTYNPLPLSSQSPLCHPAPSCPLHSPLSPWPSVPPRAIDQRDTEVVVAEEMTKILQHVSGQLYMKQAVAAVTKEKSGTSEDLKWVRGRTRQLQGWNKSRFFRINRINRIYSIKSDFFD